MYASKNLDAGAPSRPPAPKQRRALITRQQITAAARRIFAERGFEFASVEEIAAAAGKTRGAFYTNFKDKEDVFFAIFEEDIARDQERATLHLAEASTPEERVDVLARHLLPIVRDRARMMLSLEFKLYAIRYGGHQKRLADLHAAMCARCADTDLAKLMPEFDYTDPARKRKQSAQIGAILDGLALDSMFDEGSISDEQALRLLRSNLRVVLGLA